MMFLTHLLFGILTGMLGCSFLGCNNTLIFISTAALASSFPDIDHVGSKISRLLQPIAIVTKLFFSHRGFLHSLFPPFAFYIIMAASNKELAAAVMIGYASHIILDATTKKGIQPFAPLSKFRIKGFVKTNGFSEKILLFVLIIVIAVSLYA